MKLTRTLSISEDEFYDHLENELLATIQECSLKELSAKDIKKGLKYSKNEGNANARIDVTILEYERGTIFKSITKTLTDTIVMSFETEIEEKGLKVLFLQDIESFNKKRRGAMRVFSEGVYLGRMSETIYGIQSKIEKQREALAKK